MHDPARWETLKMKIMLLVLICGDDTDTDNNSDVFITPRPHHLLYSNQGGYIIWVGVLFRASTKLMLIVSDPMYHQSTRVLIYHDIYA
jgi:hypothetical protein